MSRSIPPQHILVIDDDSSVQNTLRLTLTFERNTVELAINGREALEKLDKHKFDIVFTDLIMPQMLGKDLARCIRQKYPHQVIVMMTAYPDFLDSDGKETDLADITIVKPFSLGTITNALERAYKINKHRKKSESPLPPTPP